MKIAHVEKEIAGYKYRVVYDLNATASLESAVDAGAVKLTALAMLEKDASSLTPTAMTVLFWCGLATYHPDLSLRDFRARHTPEDMTALADVIKSARKLSDETLPEAEIPDPAFPTGGLG